MHTIKILTARDINNWYSAVGKASHVALRYIKWVTGKQRSLTLEKLISLKL